MISAIIVAVVSYLIGSINSSILISRIVSGKDIRDSGSGNAGATNMLRTMGKKYAVITLIIDILKGVAAVMIARLMVNRWSAPEWLEYVAGVLVVIGHNFPVFFGFKGGKGVATSLGVILLLNWRIGLIVLGAALLIMVCTRYVSLGSIIGALAFVMLEIMFMAVHKDIRVVELVCSVILAALLIVRHHANIGRLLSGTENKLGAKKKEG